MYCQSAERECGYLEQIKRLREDAVLSQATCDDVSILADAQKIEKEADGYFEESLHCDTNFCVALGQAVRNSVVEVALRRKG